MRVSEQSRSHFTAGNQQKWLLATLAVGVPLVMLVVVMLANTRQIDLIESDYGRTGIVQDDVSVNGTGVLAGMFRKAGFQTSSWSRLSAYLDDVDVIVWVPDDFKKPTTEQRKWLESWLDASENRTLIYVGRDFDASIKYWNDVRSDTPPEQVAEVVRRQANATAGHLLRRNAAPAKQDLGWFIINSVQPLETTPVLTSPDGIWMDGIDAAKIDLNLTGFIEIPKPKSNSPDEYACDVLLQADERILVARLETKSWKRQNCQIIGVANSSFLLNLPLVNKEHRKLAARLINECVTDRKTAEVVFLESGPGGPRQVDEESDSQAPTGLEVLTVWPLSIISLHLSVLGIIACVHLFPIFGRPRRVLEDSTGDFGRHIDAIGELLEKTKNSTYATTRIAQYRELAHREIEHVENPLSRSEEATYPVVPAKRDLTNAQALSSKLPLPLTPENAPQLAQYARQTFATIQLDFTPESLHDVDRVIQKLRQHGSRVDDVARAKAIGLGCYAGELLVRYFAGRWYVPSDLQIPVAGRSRIVVVMGKVDPDTNSPQPIIQDPVRQALKYLDTSNTTGLYYCFQRTQELIRQQKKTS